MNEAYLIELIKKTFASLVLPKEYLGIGDDCAVVPPLKESMVLSSDMLVEGVDFELSWASYQDVGYKALAVNLSDIAAMGAKPVGFLMNLGLPSSTTIDQVQLLLSGMVQCAEEYSCPLLGGDLSAIGNQLVISITLIGEGKSVFKRGTCMPGDKICLTGHLGLARAGLEILQQSQEQSHYATLVQAQLRPQPHVGQGLLLQQCEGVTAVMDISDGLAQDLPRLLGAHFGADIFYDQLPIHEELERFLKTKDSVSSDYHIIGGEEFCLLVTVTPQAYPMIQTIMQNHNWHWYEIGVVTDDKICLHRSDGKLYQWPKGFDHFQRST